MHVHRRSVRTRPNRLRLTVAPLLASAVAFAVTAGCSRQAPTALGGIATGTPASRAPQSASGSGSVVRGDAGSPAVGCRSAYLSLAVAGVQQAAQGRYAVLALTNTGTTACYLRGFPGVDLLGPDDPVFGPRYSLPRASKPAPTVNLAPGDSAHAVIQFLVAEPGTTRWTPTRVLVTPPDTTGQLTAPWPTTVALQRQDAATHPVTFVGPILPNAL